MNCFRNSSQRVLFFVATLAILAGCSALFPHIAHALTPTNMLSQNMYTWFTGATASTPNSTYAAPYVMTPVGNKLFFNFSPEWPDFNGGRPVFGYFDGSTLNSVTNETEQDGSGNIAVDNGIVFTPGLDPAAGDDWDAGNLYKYDTNTSTYTKMRYRYGSQHFVAATTTDSNGNYSFTGLKPTAYLLKVIKPLNYTFTGQFKAKQLDNGVFKDPYRDSNADASGNMYQCNSPQLTEGVDFTHPYTDNTIDTGLKSQVGAAGSQNNGTTDPSFFTGNVTLGDRVWIDTNADGIQDPGELGLAGVRVELYTQDPYFPCVIHSNTVFADPDTHYIYYIGGISVPDVDPPDTYANAGHVIFRSTDDGVNWTPVYTSPNTEFYYFSNAMGKFNGYFYKKESGENFQFDIPPYSADFTTRMQYSTDLQNWTSFTGADAAFLPLTEIFGDGDLYNTTKFAIDPREHFVNFRNSLVDLNSASSELYRFTNGGAFRMQKIHGFTMGDLLPLDNNVNFAVTDNFSGESNRTESFAAVNDQYLYALSDDNRLFVTSNMRTWKEVANFANVGSGARAVSVVYWPSTNRIVVATAGSTGSMYYLDHTTVVNSLFTKISANSNLTLTDAGEDLSTLNMSSVGSLISGPVRINRGQVAISDVDTTFSSLSLDWSMVNADADVSGGKSFVAHLNDAPSVASTHTLYIPIPGGSPSTQAMICPQANNFDDISLHCTNGVLLKENETKSVGSDTVSLRKVSIGGQSYWAASGVSGTGGMSVIDGTDLGSNSCSQISPGMLAPQIVSSQTLGPTSVNLVFTTAETPYDHYHIQYGETKDNLIYGADFNATTSTIQFPVGDLKPYTTYYFELRAGQGCATGPWSEIYTYNPAHPPIGGSQPAKAKTTINYQAPQTVLDSTDVTGNTSPDTLNATASATPSSVPSNDARLELSQPSPTQGNQPVKNQQLSWWQRLLQSIQNFFAQIIKAIHQFFAKLFNWG